ncbi:MAG: Txe/YoeB family addiction module toxin [Puniceicoccales bacterium]|nr:Txe/YoeB family addiction module toxin [Puniceicoccales bacterium]
MISKETHRARTFSREYAWFVRHDPVTLLKIDRLVEDVIEHPLSGRGRPEALRSGKGNVWSRRIDKKNRLVYHIDEEVVLLLHCRGHYEA